MSIFNHQHNKDIYNDFVCQETCQNYESCKYFSWQADPSIAAQKEYFKEESSPINVRIMDTRGMEQYTLSRLMSDKEQHRCWLYSTEKLEEEEEEGKPIFKSGPRVCPEQDTCFSMGQRIEGEEVPDGANISPKAVRQPQFTAKRCQEYCKYSRPCLFFLFNDGSDPTKPKFCKLFQSVSHNSTTPEKSYMFGPKYCSYQESKKYCIFILHIRNIRLV